MITRAYAFVDGGYLTKVGQKYGVRWPCPTSLANQITGNGVLRAWESRLGRVTYYDGLPNQEESETDARKQERENRMRYWDFIEQQHVTHLGFGYARRGKDRSALRQKAVDTLIAVDMLVGAFDGIYDLALLVAGDADFVPVVEEVRRKGRWVVVAAEKESLSPELLRAADRVQLIEREPERQVHWPGPIYLTNVSNPPN